MKNLFGWIVVGVTAVFVVFNLESASVWFFGIRAQMPLALVVIASAFLGALATYAFTSLKGRK
ncbi:MAG: LapA family protein [Planctomycetes bacterium]|nr:LapA family protein [Planctomycetota bacterium]